MHKHLAGGEIFDTVADPADEQEMAAAVLSHLRSTECRMDAHFSLWTHEAGFPDPRTFSIELERSRRGRAGRDRMRDQLAEILGEPSGADES